MMSESWECSTCGTSFECRPGEKAAVSIADRRIAELEAELADIHETHREIMAEECAPDEMHCTCVPVLRAEVERLKADCIGWKTALARDHDAWQQCRDDTLHGIEGFDNDQVNEVLGILDECEPSDSQLGADLLAAARAEGEAKGRREALEKVSEALCDDCRNGKTHLEVSCKAASFIAALDEGGE